ncbi:MAG TPA: NrfD/PsrC family molybdoenzyme membrane anchor subunit [Candidatus Acidoferrum sp.]|nr:NrfD/PsrC family molybdoenzyme membrane anchor subunit [Candidatus Acidoferrum sp.]
MQEIKRIAGETSLAPGAAKLGSHPQITGHDSYYGLPALKPPVWTWEIPLYFFLGGISGVSGCMAFVAHLLHADPGLVRVLLWVGFIGSAICPMLLIADLGRPARFLNMLRVFKWRSAMSMGAWILIGFSACITPALFANELILRGFDWPILGFLRWSAEAGALVTGLLLAGYTGVLIGATANPLWSANRRVLPVHFLTSGMGGASAILELAGFFVLPTQILGFIAAGVETLLDLKVELRKPAVDAPLHHGPSGIAFRIAGLLEGPGSLLVRLFWGSTHYGRLTAAIFFLVGSALSRYAWIWAGRVSARQPNVEFARQRAGEARP